MAIFCVNVKTAMRLCQVKNNSYEVGFLFFNLKYRWLQIFLGGSVAEEKVRAAPSYLRSLVDLR